MLHRYPPSALTDATKTAANPAGQDVVYWIAPENGAKIPSTRHVFHLCEGVDASVSDAKSNWIATYTGAADAAVQRFLHRVF